MDAYQPEPGRRYHSGVDYEAVPHANYEHNVRYQPTTYSEAMPRSHTDEGKSQAPKSEHRPPGWKKGLRCCILLTVTVFFFNWGSMVFVLAKHKNEGSLPQISEASCTETKRLSLWVHLLINILGTAVLGASNYTMQILSSPRRQDVDKAHGKGDWLDIGVPGMRNIRPRRIGWSRVLRWWCLLLSSVPLHLLYNSVMFTTVATNVYMAAVAPQSFVDGKPIESLRTRYEPEQGIRDRLRYIQDNGKGWERLEKDDCILEYARAFVANRHDLIVVTANSSLDSLEWHTPVYGDKIARQPYEWIFTDAHRQGLLGKSDHRADALANLGTWTVGNREVSHCISEKTDANCTLHYHLPIMAIVVVCNIIKLAAMIWTLFTVPDDSLITVGDAVVSYLTVPDVTMRGLCATSERVMNKNRPYKHHEPRPQLWDSGIYKWRNAAAQWIWIGYILLTVASLSVIGVLLSMAKAKMKTLTLTNISALWDLGFGTVDTSSMFGLGDSGTPRSEPLQIVMVNLPQAIYSFIYLFYNNIMTRMLLAREWTLFAHRRKALRVSNPVGRQRSTYFLQLPYRYAAPLMAFSALMHWLVSQGLFFVKVRAVVHGEEDSVSSFHTMGWSAIAMIFVMIGGSVMTAVVILLGFRSYPVGIPFARSCSRVFSAACQNTEGDRVCREEVQWGVVGNWDHRPEVYHCTFSDGIVRLPRAEDWYAGERN